MPIFREKQREFRNLPRCRDSTIFIVNLMPVDKAGDRSDRSILIKSSDPMYEAALKYDWSQRTHEKNTLLKKPLPPPP